MISDLYDLYQAMVRVFAGDEESGLAQDIFVVRVELIAVAVSLGDVDTAVRLFCKRSLFQETKVLTQPHRASQVLDTFEFPPLKEYFVGRFGVELCAVGILQADNAAGIFDGCSLHSQADAEKRDFLFPGVSHSLDLAFDPPYTKPARDKNPVRIRQDFFGFMGLESLCFYPENVDFEMVGYPSVIESLVETHVRILKTSVLSHQGNIDFIAGILHPVHQGCPAGEISLLQGKVQEFQDDLIQVFLGVK